jgi:hypothetical protein
MCSLTHLREYHYLCSFYHPNPGLVAYSKGRPRAAIHGSYVAPILLSTRTRAIVERPLQCSDPHSTGFIRQLDVARVKR